MIDGFGVMFVIDLGVVCELGCGRDFIVVAPGNCIAMVSLIKLRVGKLVS